LSKTIIVKVSKPIDGQFTKRIQTFVLKCLTQGETVAFVGSKKRSWIEKEHLCNDTESLALKKNVSCNFLKLVQNQQWHT